MFRLINKEDPVLTFAKIEQYYEESFVYSHITDAQIREVDRVLLQKVDAQLEWEDDNWLSATPKIKPELKHAYRVAAVVDSLGASGLQNSLCLDTMGPQYVCALPDGHHRVRALQFLGFDSAPCSLSGYEDENEKLVLFSQKSEAIT